MVVLEKFNSNEYRPARTEMYIQTRGRGEMQQGSLTYLES